MQSHQRSHINITRSRMRTCATAVITTLIFIEISQLVAFQSKWHITQPYLRSQTDGKNYSKLSSSTISETGTRNEKQYLYKEEPFEDYSTSPQSRRNFFSSIVSSTATVASAGIAMDTIFALPANATTELSDGKISEFSNDISSNLIAAATGNPEAVDLDAILKKSTKRALGGGKAGAFAALCQVLTLMWLRTSMNYQYRYGGTLSSSLSTLYEEGGIPRLYQGLPFALVQGPLTRFGDTAANVGILALLESFPETATLPLFVKTFGGSVAAGTWRIFCMPVDTCKTVLQVEGSKGLGVLRESISEEGFGRLYRGSLASAGATAAGHFPWYLTYNTLGDILPSVNSKEELLLYLGRAAFIGLCSSCVSDCVSNSFRVIKTTKQTADEDITYREAFDMVIDQDGVQGLFGRGLQTRLITNMIQGAIFSVLWKYFQSTM